MQKLVDHVCRGFRFPINGYNEEAIIIFDDSSVPDADAYLIDADYPIESYLKKIPASVKVVSYARIT